MSFPNVYTIDVGPLEALGRREITLLHQGQPCFSTTHEAVQSALLIKFPELHFTSSHEPPFSIPSSDSLPDEPCFHESTSAFHHSSPPPSQEANRAEGTRMPTTNVIPYYSSPAFKLAKSTDYLCVFHIDELHRPYEDLTGVSFHPSMVCTSYEIHSCTPQQFPLPDICPEYFCPGVFGVWIHGKGGSCGEPFGTSTLPGVVEVHGLRYTAAADVWWMISPLVVHPVYVLTSSPHHEEEEWGVSPFHAFSSSLSSSPMNDAFSSANEMKVVVLKQFVARGQAMWTVVQCSADTVGLAVTTPYYPLDILLWEWLPQRVTLPGVCASSCRSHTETSNGVRMPSLDVTVSEHVELGRQILFLTSVTPSSSVFIVQTPDLLTREGYFCLLFVLPPSMHRREVRVLHCMLPTFCPQPIVVMNYPSCNQIALFDVCTLLDAGASAPSHSSDAPPCLACVSVPTAPEEGTECWKEEETKGPKKCTLKRKRKEEEEESGRGGVETQGQAGTPACHDATVEEEAIEAACEGDRRLSSAGTTHPIVLHGIVEEDGATMVFSTAPVPSPSSSSAGEARRIDTASYIPSFQRGHTSPTPHPGVTVLHCPSFLRDHPPMLCHVLEILRATLGTKALWELQYASLREAWKTTRAAHHHTLSSRLLMVLYACMIETVGQSLYGNALPSFPSSFARFPPIASSSSSASSRPRSMRTKEEAGHGGNTSPSPDALGWASKGWRGGAFSSPSFSSLLSFDGIEKTSEAIRVEREARVEGGGGGPTPTATPTGTTGRVEVPPLWSPYTCGLLCIGMHLLYESAKLQESLWSSLLVLGEVNLALSQLLRWKAYHRFYHSLHGNPPFSKASCGSAIPDGGAVAMRQTSEDWAEAVAHATPVVSIPSASTVRREAFRQRILVDISVLYQEEEEEEEATNAAEEEEEEEKPLALLSLLRQMVEWRGQGGRNGSAACPTQLLSQVLQDPHHHHQKKKKKEHQDGVLSPSSHPSPLSWWVLAGVQAEEHPLALSHHVYSLYALAFHDVAFQVHLSSSSFTAALPSVFTSSSSLPPWWWRVIAGLCSDECPLSSAMVHHQLSLGVAYPLLQAIARGRANVGNNAASLTDKVLATIGRIDVIRSRSVQPRSRTKDAEGKEEKIAFASTDGKGEGMSVSGADVVRLGEERAISWSPLGAWTEEDDGIQMPPDFPSMWIDSRLERALKLLNTTVHVPLRDADVKAADTDAMEILSWRVCASPIARGMILVCTNEYKSCDRIPIPPLNLNGMSETGIVVPIHDFGAHKGGETLLWAFFHNSCAAGLRFFPLRRSSSSSVDGGMANGSTSSTPTPYASVSREKLLYQARSVETIARAGLLFAAGLLGHFEPLQLTDVYTFLTAPEQDLASRDLITIALLLGLSGTYRGSSNPTVFKCLSVHILSLTPSEEEVEIRLNVQTAAFVAVGLLCQSQPLVANAFLLDVLLVEMTRRPTDEHCYNREGYALGAAFGLGLILLGCGHSAAIQTCRSPIVETLLKVMDGEEREDLDHIVPGFDAFHEKDLSTQDVRDTNAFIKMGAPARQVCSSVYEGGAYNTVVAGPAAVMALGLMFLQTEDVLTATRVALPHTFTRLIAITPTMCLFRSLVAPLICWSSIVPTTEWVYAQAPRFLNELFLEKLHYPSTFVQVRQYCRLNWGYAIAGSVLALGLRYAGTMHPLARRTILAELQGFLRHEIGSSGVGVTAAQKSNGAFVRCITSCCIAASMVMAGTGDAELFHLFQALHQRVGVQDRLSYGVYMAVSMSIGFLFLGGGRLTLSNSTSSIAALLIAVYPIWPSEMNDNRHHLQAFRHLYVLAMVPRIIDAVDVHTQRPVSVPVRVLLRKGQQYTSQGEVEARRASGLCRASSGVPAFQDLHRREASPFKDYPEGEEGERGTPHGRPSEYFFTSPGEEDGVDFYATSTSSCGEVHKERGCVDSRPLEQREVYMQTPCLYPPPDIVKRIDVCSPRHYAIRIAQKKGPIPSCGILLQVLRKAPETVCLDAEEEWMHSFHAADHRSGARTPHDETALSYRNPIEARMADWTKRFFHPPTIPLAESMWILENAKIIFACQRSFMGEFSPPSQHLLSLDVGYAVHQTLERHYQPLLDPDALFCLRSSTHDASPASSYSHPLYLLLIQHLSPGEVLHHWTPVRNAPRAAALVHAEEQVDGDRRKAMPHSATLSDSLMPNERAGTSSSSGNHHGGAPVASPASWEGSDTLEQERMLHHWLTQALCFYDLTSLKGEKLANALPRLRNGETADRGGVEPHLSAKIERASMLLNLQRELEIPYQTLRKVLACCSEEGENSIRRDIPPVYIE